MRKPLIMILGPTGVGKSDFAIKLAEQIDGEIINCDVGQFYAPLTIGTAKPDWKRSHIVHHLYDMLNEPVHETVARYREQVKQTIRNIIGRQKIPLVVGGSGFYALSLLFKVQDTRINYDQSEQAYAQDSNDTLWHALYVIDPERAKAIHPHDRYRIIRALTVWKQTDLLPSSQKPLFDPIASHVHIIHLTRERNELYENINQRTQVMIERGWLQEVAELPDHWKSFLKEKQLIGYAEILDWLKHKHDINRLISQLQQTTRRYAKRQLTFWRMFKKKIETHMADPAIQGKYMITIDEIDLTFCDVHLYIKRLMKG